MLKIGEIWFTESDEGEIKLNQNFLGINETTQIDVLQDLMGDVNRLHSEAMGRWRREMAKVKEEGWIPLADISLASRIRPILLSRKSDACNS